MSVLELTDEQVIMLVKQLPTSRKRVALFALAEEAQARRADRMNLAEGQLRTQAAKRGLDWDLLTEAEREDFIDRLLHEN